MSSIGVVTFSPYLLHAVLRELPQIEMYTVKQLLKYTLKGSTLH